MNYDKQSSSHFTAKVIILIDLFSEVKVNFLKKLQPK